MKLERVLKNCQTAFTIENFKNINLKGISNNSKEIKDNFSQYENTKEKIVNDLEH